MNKRLIIPLLFFLSFFITSAFATPVNYTSTYDLGDGGVYSNHGDTNYGSVAGMYISNGTTVQSYAYILWDVPTIIPLTNVTVNSAYVYLYVQSATNASTYYYNVYNTSLNWNEANLTWNAQPTIGTLQERTAISATVGSYMKFNVTNAMKNAVSTGKKLSVMVQFNTTTAAGYQWTFSTKESTGAGTGKPKLEIDYSVPNCLSDCGDCGCNADNTGCRFPSIIGSYCDIEDGLNNTIKTVPNASCTGTSYFTCPSGTMCTQVSPVFNFSNSGVFTRDNSTWCSGCFFFNLLTGFPPHWTNVRTNCPDKPECNCYGVWCSNSIYETNSSYDNNTIPEWTAGCFNPTSGLYANIINSTAQNTTIEALTDQYCTNCNLTNQTPSSCFNTTTSCYDIGCNPVSCTVVVPAECSSNSGGQLALSLGALMGITDCGLAQGLLAIVASISVGFALLYYTRDSEHNGQAFIFGTLIMLVMFTFVSWFPAWLMLILIVLGGYLVAKSMGFGGS